MIFGASLALALLGGCGDESSTARLTVEQCEAWKGHVIADPGDGSSYSNGCPAGERLLGNVSFGIEGGICCGPIGPF